MTRQFPNLRGATTKDLRNILKETVPNFNKKLKEKKARFYGLITTDTALRMMYAEEYQRRKKKPIRVSSYKAKGKRTTRSHKRRKPRNRRI